MLLRKIIKKIIFIILRRKTYLQPPEAFEKALKKTQLRPTSFLEIGSRDGLNAYAIAEKFSINSENVHIVEAHPQCSLDIKERFPLFNLYERAMYNEEGELYFNMINEGNRGVSSLKDRNDDYYDDKSVKIKVRAQRADTFLIENKIEEIDICKIDVEGCSFEVLEGFGNDINKIKAFHIECEHRVIWQNQKVYTDVDSYLKSKGYKRIYFNYLSKYKWQSDSVWIQENYI